MATLTKGGNAVRGLGAPSSYSSGKAFREAKATATTGSKTATQPDASVLKDFITPGMESQAESIAKSTGQSIYGKEQIKPIEPTKPITEPTQPATQATVPVTQPTQMTREGWTGTTTNMTREGWTPTTPVTTTQDETQIRRTMAETNPKVDISDPAQSKAEANKMYEGLRGTPPPQNGENLVLGIETGEDEVTNQFFKDLQDYLSPKKTTDTLMSMYKGMISAEGIPELNSEMINIKNVIDGNEDMIRDEITKAGGFATEGQVMAMTNARNKTLIAQYNKLLDTKNATMEYINNSMQYAQADRTYAAQQMESRMNLGFKVLEYRDKAKQYSVDNFNKIIDKVGYAGLLSMTNNDPYTISKVEKALGLGTGGLAQLAAQPDLDRQIKEAQLAELRGGKGAKAPTIQKINGVDMQWEPTTGTWVKPSVSQTTGQDLTADQLGISAVDDLLNNKTGMATSVGTSYLSRSTGFWGNIGRILTSMVGYGAAGAAAGSVIPGVGTVVGGVSGLVAGLFGGLLQTGVQKASQLSGAEQDFIASTEQLVSGLTLDSLIEAKAEGATFGALSEGEMNVLAQSATKIGKWARKDTDGNVIGYNIDEYSFQKELQTINNMAKLDYLRKGGKAEDIGVNITPDGRMWVKDFNDNLTEIRTY